MTLRFYDSNDPNGGFEDYTNNPSDTRTFSAVGEIGNGDLWLGKLSTPVIANIAKYPILSNAAGTSPTNFYNTNPVIYTWGVGTGGTADVNGLNGTSQRLGRNQIDWKAISGGNRESVFPDLTDLGSSTTGSNFRWLYSTNTLPGYSHFDLGSDESMVQGGDSAHLISIWPTESRRRSWE